ncbi:MAG: glycosyltransferase family 39 protein [Chloroflexi bacterium]|nr:glycosyltransferase family 39 protein [Chloroflexota bacterium]
MLGAILLVALVLRLWGLDFGLPYTLQVDEGALVMPALKILQTGDFNPHRFDYGSLHIYLLSLVYAGYFLFGARLGIFQTIQDIPVIDDYHTIAAYPYPSVFLVGRAVSALLGVATVYGLYRLCTRVFNQRVGLVAAGLLAVLPAAVRQSHFIVSDTSMNLLLLVAVEMLVVAYRSASSWPLVAAGLLTGLAASAKQTAIQLSVALVGLAVVRPAASNRRALGIISGLTGVVIGFLLGTPFAVFDLPTFLNWQAYDLRLYARPGAVVYEGPSWWWHLRYLMTSENSVLLILALIGAIIAVRRLRWPGLLLMAFPVAHWISMSLQGTRYDRTWLPITSFMCMFAAVGIVAAANWLSAHQLKLRERPRLVAVAITLMVVLPLTLGSALIDIQFSEKEVRIRTLEWIEQNLPKGSHLALEISKPPLSADDWQITTTVYLPQHDLDWYRAQGVEYLVVSAAGAWNPNRSVTDEQWYQYLRATCEPLAVITGPGLGLPNRYFWIYELKSCPA